MRIGILGGSFNPVHKDHYLLASYVKDVLSFDKFLIIPNAMPPHKNTCHISFAIPINSSGVNWPSPE